MPHRVYCEGHVIGCGLHATSRCDLVQRPLVPAAQGLTHPCVAAGSADEEAHRDEVIATVEFEPDDHVPPPLDSPSDAGTMGPSPQPGATMIPLLIAILSSTSAAAGAMAASSIGRSEAGAVLGLLLGPLGVLIVATGSLTPQRVLDERAAARRQAKLDREATKGAAKP